MPRFLTILFQLLVLHLTAQEYNYIHYDTKDGLPSSMVYAVCQDKKGYVWFATDNGVSRFDGKKFTNFTTDDGLTDNEVLAIKADSKGRVWILPFNKSLCYYYNGKIYEIKINSSIKKGFISSNISYVGENSYGDCYFGTTEGLFAFKNADTLKLIADLKKLSAKYSIPLTKFFLAYFKFKEPYPIHLYAGHSVFMIRNDSIIYVKSIKKDFFKQPMNFYTVNEMLEPMYPKSDGLKEPHSVFSIKGTHFFFNTQNGSWPVDMNGNVAKKPFLPGKKVSFAYADTEGNIWFSTLGEGVYRLTSGSMKTIAGNVEAFSIEKNNERIYAGLTDGRLEIIKKSQLEREYFPVVFPLYSSRNRLYTLKDGPNGVIYLGYDSHFEKFDNGKHIISPLRPIKSIDTIDNDHIIVSTNFFTFKIRSSDLEITDTIWRERGTKVLYDKGICYIGTLNGLVIIDSLKNVTKTATNTPLLSNRIVDMCKAADGGIWVATNDNGIVRYNKGRADVVINTSNGLSSNNCKTLFLKGQYLWAGTNKGINKIDINTKKVLAKYSMADGLTSDIINDLYIEDSLVWVCSPGGITFFNEKEISDSSICNLDLHTVMVSGNKIDSARHLKLNYKNNNISFEFAGISFKSAGEILYRYKLTGLDNEWKETRLTTLAYPSLPAGKYTFQLYAVNKFGKQSEMTAIAFSITAPFWQTLWFWLVISLTVLWLTSYLIIRRYKILQRKTKEKNDLTKRVTELEQASLRAQMNPHFIFNCLSSIQHFILKNDIEKTNKYITQFASLIRQTLDNSAKINISIADELKYLTGYLELEKMRFPAAFNYSIRTDTDMHTDYVYIPSMILQPFIENAIRHGIRHKEEGVGSIKINVTKKPHGILFSIEDNGVGRKAAAGYKSDQHIEYQSKGIMLATNRLELLSAAGGEKITTQITDLVNENGLATGTKVEIQFPDSIIEKLN